MTTEHYDSLKRGTGGAPRIQTQPGNHGLNLNAQFRGDIDGSFPDPIHNDDVIPHEGLTIKKIKNQGATGGRGGKAAN